MNIGKMKYLREELEAERIDLEELSEIEAAFAQIPDSELRDLRENATAKDMLDELEDRVTPLERCIYEYVADVFGESEADDPSWDIEPLASHIEKEFKVCQR